MELWIIAYLIVGTMLAEVGRPFIVQKATYPKSAFVAILLLWGLIIPIGVALKWNEKKR